MPVTIGSEWLMNLQRETGRGPDEAGERTTGPQPSKTQERRLSSLPYGAVLLYMGELGKLECHSMVGRNTPK